jgi:hypothetical protein
VPLIGVRDPSYKEHRRDEPGRNPNWFTLQEIRERALTEGVNWSSWDYELIEAALGEHQERDYISTTAIINKCPRSLVLERKEPYIGALDDMYAPLRGTLLHAMLQRVNRAHSFAEHRFFAEVDGTQVSGSPDLVTQDTIKDYKMTESPPDFYPWGEHKLQAQYNRWLVNNCTHWEAPEGEESPKVDPHTLNIKHLVVTYIGPKKPKPIEVRSNQPWTYANGKKGTKKQPEIWSDQQVMDHMLPRLQALRCALEVYPEWPEGVESLWGGPEGWACPGRPWCTLPNCLAKRYPHGLTWEKPEE